MCGGGGGGELDRPLSHQEQWRVGRAILEPYAGLASHRVGANSRADREVVGRWC